MQKKSLLSKQQEASATAVPPQTTKTKNDEMTLVPVAGANNALATLMGEKPLVAGVVETASTPHYLYGWWGTGDQKPIAGVGKGDLVLSDDGEHAKINPPIVGFICTGRQQWVERIPATQKIVRASLQQQPRGGTMSEEIEAMLLIFAPDGHLVPVTWRGKKGVCRGLVTCLKELQAAATPEWVAQSEAHRIVGQITTPWMRFSIRIDYHLRDGGNGNQFPITSASTQPIDVNTFSKLRDFLASSDNQTLLAEVYAAHELKLKEVDEKLAG